MSLINIATILEKHPSDTKLYSPLVGEVLFRGIEKYDRIICYTPSDENKIEFNQYGQYFLNCPQSECMLFPSKENRDWNSLRMDLPIDTAVLVNDTTSLYMHKWAIRHYAGKSTCFRNNGCNACNAGAIPWAAIVPLDKANICNGKVLFNPKDDYGTRNYC